MRELRLGAALFFLYICVLDWGKYIFGGNIYAKWAFYAKIWEILYFWAGSCLFLAEITVIIAEGIFLMRHFGMACGKLYIKVYIGGRTRYENQVV